MKTMVLLCLVIAVCLLMAVVGSNAQDAAVQTGAFAEANRLGEPPQVTFFLFSTSYGNYIISQYGLGEVGIPGKHPQFVLKGGMTGRVQRMYFLAVSYTHLTLPTSD